jgi:hypothetical protein
MKRPIFFYSEILGEEGKRGRGRRGFWGFSFSPFLLFSSSILFLLLSFTSAQTAQDAINLAAEHPAFAKGLADRPNWSANAYETKNRYNIWRVEFYDEGGNGLGWADVSLEKSRLFAWDAAVEVIETQYAEAEEKLLEFLRNDPTAQEMVGSVDDAYGYWVGYDSWRECWMVHIERGADSLDLTLRSRRSESRSLEDLYLEKVYAANVMSYGDWQNASGAQVVAVAFENPEIAAAVRDVDGWTTATEKLDGEAWKVRFLSGETVIAEADVNMADGSLANINITQ